MKKTLRMNNIKSISAKMMNHDTIYNYLIIAVEIKSCRHCIKFKKLTIRSHQKLYNFKK